MGLGEDGLVKLLKEKVSGNKNKKWKLWRSSSGDLSTRWKGFSKGSHHRAALETSECSSTADAFNVAVATVVRAPPKNFRVVRQEWVAIRIQTAFRGSVFHGTSKSSLANWGSLVTPIQKMATEAHETLPQSAEFPADVFTSCLTTPIKMALRWFCARSLLCDTIDHSLIDKIHGRQNDRKTFLGELNWIFTAVTDTIACNVLPHGKTYMKAAQGDSYTDIKAANILLTEAFEPQYRANSNSSGCVIL
ncbi:hypothetical protein IFM89_009206 [Coptis chinensis]|uniref:Uncharacterized protein n=1 Tax=Coptis chinensis TaxID=261450 RepID=A0A835IZC3_9MAGN|nr:hypothetical protein IFM89_009206 [Coptis chinensis]